LPNATTPASSPGGMTARLSRTKARHLARVDAVREIDDEDRRQAIDGQHELESGQGEDEPGQQPSANGERRPMTANAGPPPGRDRRDHGREEERHQEQEPRRALEADAHQPRSGAGGCGGRPPARPFGLTARWRRQRGLRHRRRTVSRW
jgi:hypothetical protein